MLDSYTQISNVLVNTNVGDIKRPSFSLIGYEIPDDMAILPGNK